MKILLKSAAERVNASFNIPVLKIDIRPNSVAAPGSLRRRKRPRGEEKMNARAEAEREGKREHDG